MGENPTERLAFALEMLILIYLKTLISGFDEQTFHCDLPSTLGFCDLAKAEKIYSWVAEACGNELGKVMTKERIEQIVREKAELDLLS